MPAWRTAAPFAALGFAAVLLAVVAMVFFGQSPTAPAGLAVQPTLTEEASTPAGATTDQAGMTPGAPPSAGSAAPSGVRAALTTSARTPSSPEATQDQRTARTTTAATPRTAGTTRATGSPTSRSSTPAATRSTTRSSTPAPDPAPAGTAGRIRWGTTYSGVATFYGATGEGNCMFEASADLMVTAMNHTDYANSLACGAWLRVSGPKGTVTVQVVDRCPECPPGALDLSAQAFARIADPVAGRVPITWTLQSPAVSGPIAFRFKEGSSQYWCAIQIRNHRNPVASVEVQVGGSWRVLPRMEYNYAVSADGTGCGGPLRVTDIHGHRLTGQPAVRPGVVQPGSGQFPSP